jgi:hypothetical protein
MDIDRFSRLLETYGADLERWPEEQRDAATRLLQSSAEAQIRHAAAARLDLLLRLGRVDADATRVRAITAAALERIRAGRRPTVGWRWLLSPPVEAVFAAMLVIGCLLGMEVPVPSADPGGPRVEPLLGALLDAPGRGVDGLIE